jgi:hypothetical protein
VSLGTILMINIFAIGRQKEWFSDCVRPRSQLMRDGSVTLTVPIFATWFSKPSRFVSRWRTNVAVARRSNEDASQNSSDELWRYDGAILASWGPWSPPSA